MIQCRLFFKLQGLSDDNLSHGDWKKFSQPWSCSKVGVTPVGHWVAIAKPWAARLAGYPVVITVWLIKSQHRGQPGGNSDRLPVVWRWGAWNLLVNKCVQSTGSEQAPAVMFPLCLPKENPCYLGQFQETGSCCARCQEVLSTLQILQNPFWEREMLYSDL